MAWITIQPTKVDEVVASMIAEHTDLPVEGVADLMTWGADEKLLMALAAVGWLCSLNSARWRPVATHIFAVSIVTANVPHLFKHVVDQTRPDRLTLEGHLHGVPLSGKPNDAFPSGHALHMGALASAAGLLPKRERFWAWALAVTLSATRVVLLAHWLTDVLAGFALGAVIERLLRRLTLGLGR